MVMVRYEYAAEIVSIDSELPIPGALSRRCDGARETTFAVEMLGPLRDGPQVTAGTMCVRCPVDEAPVVVVELTTAAEITNAQDLGLRRELQALFESGWNYEFDLPVEGCQVHFETSPRTSTADTAIREVVALAHEWPAVTFEQLAALSDAALTALLERLHAVAPVVRYDWRTPERAAVRALLEAAESQQQRRALDKLARQPRPDDDGDFL